MVAICQGSKRSCPGPIMRAISRSRMEPGRSRGCADRGEVCAESAANEAAGEQSGGRKSGNGRMVQMGHSTKTCRMLARRIRNLSRSYATLTSHICI